MRLTRKQTKVHDDVMRILQGDRLTEDECDYVLDNFRPSATTNTTKSAAFFTPRSVAIEISVMCDCDDEIVVDLGAGIGSLARGLLDGGRRPKKIVCIEQNPNFVAIGRKVVPEATWIEGDIFDQNLMSQLLTVGWVISNPPYGLKLPAYNWLAYQGQSDLMAVEVGMRLATNGGLFILPQTSVPWAFSGRQCYQEVSQRPAKLQKFMMANPHIQFDCVSVDMSVYKDAWVDGTSAVELVHAHPHWD